MRDLGPVDISPIQDLVLALPDNAWDGPEDLAANYNKRGAIRQGSHIIFRFSNRQVTPFEYSELSRWQGWANPLLSVMQDAVRPYGYRRHFFPRVMLARLPAGAFIPPHIDGDMKGFVPHKIHVPITTNQKTFFFVDGERYHFEVGRAYEVNNGVQHSVVNGGDMDRIHLLFEYLDRDIQQF